MATAAAVFLACSWLSMSDPALYTLGTPRRPGRALIAATSAPSRASASWRTCSSSIRRRGGSNSSSSSNNVNRCSSHLHEQVVTHTHACKRPCYVVTERPKHNLIV